MEFHLTLLGVGDLGDRGWQAGWPWSWVPAIKAMHMPDHGGNVRWFVTSRAKPRCPVGSEVCRILYRCRPHVPHCAHPAACLVVPCPRRGFCRLYRNWHPIFLQLSDFVNWDYTDRRKVF